MIEIKRKIPSILRQKVADSLSQHIKGINNDEIQLIRKRLEKRLKIIENSSYSIPKSLHLHVKALYILLAENGGLNIDDLSEQHLKIWGFMSYFTDPGGVIPDHVIEDGYLDDAIAINKTIRSLPKQLKNNYADILNKLQ